MAFDIFGSPDNSPLSGAGTYSKKEATADLIGALNDGLDRSSRTMPGIFVNELRSEMCHRDDTVMFSFVMGYRRVKKTLDVAGKRTELGYTLTHDVSQALNCVIHARLPRLPVFSTLFDVADRVFPLLEQQSHVWSKELASDPAKFSKILAMEIAEFNMIRGRKPANNPFIVGASMLNKKAVHYGMKADVGQGLASLISDDGRIRFLITKVGITSIDTKTTQHLTGSRVEEMTTSLDDGIMGLDDDISAQNAAPPIRYNTGILERHYNDAILHWSYNGKSNRFTSKTPQEISIDYSYINTRLNRQIIDTISKIYETIAESPKNGRFYTKRKVLNHLTSTFGAGATRVNHPPTSIIEQLRHSPKFKNSVTRPVNRLIDQYVGAYTGASARYDITDFVPTMTVIAIGQYNDNGGAISKSDDLPQSDLAVCHPAGTKMDDIVLAVKYTHAKEPSARFTYCFSISIIASNQLLLKDVKLLETAAFENNLKNVFW